MAEGQTSIIDRLQRSVNIVHNPQTGWIILGLSLVLTFAAYWFASNQVEKRAKERFAFRADEITDAIRERLLMYEQALKGGVGLFYASEQVTREEWRNYVSALHLSERLPGIQGMGYAVPLSPTQKDALTEKLHAEGFTDFSVKPEGERDEYSAIVYLEPFDWRNQRAFGYDMWSNDMRRAAMERARDHGKAATSGIITLVQETQKDVQRGFLTYLPVYHSSTAPTTVEERRKQFRGWVYAPFRAGDLMKGILGSTDNDIAFELYDGDQLLEENLLYDSNGRLSLLEQDHNLLFDLQQTISLQGRQWKARFSAPYTAVYDSAESRQPLFILLAGIIIDTLLFYVIVSLHLINRHARKSEQELLQKFELNQQSLALQARLVEATEKESETFFELAPEAFLVVSPQGLVVKANQAAHKLYGFHSGELVGVTIDRLVPPSVVERCHHMVLDGGLGTAHLADEEEIQATKSNGDAFSATVTFVPIEQRGEPHVVVAVRDVSVQKAIEQTLEEAKEKAEAASRSKSEFLANMSHEIRTPLNAVLGAAQLLNKSDPSITQRKFIQMIRSSGEALLGVINDILDFSKIEAGCMELTPVSFDLSEVLNRVAIMMSVNSGEKDIELVIKLDPRVNLSVVGDPLRLQQVLINLVSNAIKFTDTGSVILTIEASGPVEEDAQCIRFSVKDTGIGMNLAQKARLFKAFFQADASITRRFGGTGLGLVISSKILELMGSRIQIDSEMGVGSTFYFDTVFSLHGDSAGIEKSDAATARSVLIFEDNEDACTSYRYIFERIGWHARLIQHQDEIRDLAAEELRQFDFVLVDGGSFVYQEKALIDQLTELGLKADCGRVLVVQNNQQSQMLVNAKGLDYHSSLVKPVLPASLLQSLDEVAGKAKGEYLQEPVGKGKNQALKFKHVRALLVEDNVFNQTIAQGLLEDMGVAIDIANNGQEAIDKIESGEQHYDFVLMDIQMPVMDGVTATHILRKGKRYTGPIIAMTAGVLQSERETYLSAGMDDLVPKPIDSNDLFRALVRAMPEDRRLQAMDDGESEALGANVAASLEQLGSEKEFTVFNHSRMATLTKGKPKRIRGIISSLEAIRKSGVESIESGVQAIKNQDYEKAHFAFHGLKGVVANYGGEQLADCIKNLEVSLREQRGYTDVSDELTKIQKAFEQFIVESQEWIQEQEAILAQDIED